jgi:hypothetical protein
VEALPFKKGPVEDAGATTQGFYRFQYCRAAARLLAAIKAGTDLTIICEHHEDYLVLDSTPLRAVSVKSRDQTKTRWTLSALVGDGKLGHLYKTYRRAKDPINCSFESNRAHDVADLWSDEEIARRTVREDLAARLCEAPSDVDGFVDHLTIDSTLPASRDIAAAYATNFAAPALDSLGVRQLDAGRAMTLATDLIAAASREGLSADALGQLLLADPGQLPDIFSQLQVEERTVNTDQLRAALEAAASAVVPRIPAATRALAEPVPDTTMTKKLERGGLGPSVVSSAGNRRALWFAHRARYRDIVEREEELDSLEEWVQDQANAAEGVARAGGPGPYGPEMLDDLMDRLGSAEAFPRGIRRVDGNPALLAGAAFELTDACSVWWSDRFQIGEPDEES